MEKIIFKQNKEVKLGDKIDLDTLKSVEVTQELIDNNPLLFEVEEDTPKYLRCVNPSMWEECIKHNGGVVFDINFKHQYYSKPINSFLNYPGVSFVAATEQEYVNQELLKEAKKRYPIGTRVKCLSDGDVQTIKSHECDPTCVQFNYNNSIWYNSGNCQVHLDGEWAEVIEEKTLDDYRSTLINADGESEYNYYWWLYKNEPKLYWAKALSLIAEDLNEGWIPNFNSNITKFNIDFTDEDVNYHCGGDEGAVYFKEKALALKAIKLLGDNIKHLK